MKKLFWRFMVILALAISWVIYSHPDWLVIPPAAALSSVSSDKCYSNCTNPNRPSYDLWGNEFDYQGNLIKAACPNVADPISHQDNTECVCKSDQYLQSYDKNTNAAICHDDTQAQPTITETPVAVTPDCTSNFEGK